MEFNQEHQDQLAKSLSSKLGFDPNSLQRFKNGSAAVYRVGLDSVLKLQHPNWTSDKEAELESTCLRILSKQFKGFTPELIDSGKEDDIHYLLMGDLQGEDLLDVWKDVSLENRLQIFEELGNKTKAMHSVDPHEFIPYCENWNSFLDQQIAKCVQNHTKKELQKEWLSEVAPWIESIDWKTEKKKDNVILHTEIMRDHLKVIKTKGEWQLSGIFDFGDAMVGPKEYEFVSIGCLAAGGEKDLLQAFFKGYGYQPEKDFSKMMMAYLLIHKYSNIEWFLDHVPISQEIHSLDGLASVWYGV